MRVLAKICSFFLEIFFPKRCLGCYRAGVFLCLECASKIEKITTPTCPNRGKISINNQYCSSCKKHLKPELKGILVATNFEVGPTKEIIHHLKYAGFIELSEVLGELICQRLLMLDFKYQDFIIVPVPLHAKKLKERGFNQSELIARYISKKLKIPGGDVLRRIKHTETQTKLSKELRQKNVLQAFICEDKELIKGRDVLLIDDVVTTGATLNECAKVLIDSGAKRIWGVVSAKRQ